MDQNFYRISAIHNNEPRQVRRATGEVRTHNGPDTLVTFNSLPVVALSPLKGLCKVHDRLSLLPSFIQFNDTALCDHCE
jgi:hypothetical protein